jgi:hypothetical protein
MLFLRKKLNLFAIEFLKISNLHRKKWLVLNIDNFSRETFYNSYWYMYMAHLMKVIKNENNLPIWQPILWTKFCFKKFKKWSISFQIATLKLIGSLKSWSSCILIFCPKLVQLKVIWIVLKCLKACLCRKLWL